MIKLVIISPIFLVDNSKKLCNIKNLTEEVTKEKSKQLFQNLNKERKI